MQPPPPYAAMRDDFTAKHQNLKFSLLAAKSILGLLLLTLCIFCGGWNGLEQSPTSNLVPFIENGRWGYLDIKTGEWLIKPRFVQAQNFSEGLAPVCFSSRWGYIDERGAFVIKPMFWSAGPFSEGAAFVSLSRSNYGYINRTGKIIATSEPNPINPRHCVFSEGRGLISTNGRFGYVDEKGAVVIKPQYKFAKRFSGGFATVAINGSWRFIDKAGKVREAIKTDALSFGDSRTGEFSEGYVVAQSTTPPGNLGYVAADGHSLLMPQLMEAGPFSEGLACVRGIEHPGTNLDRAGPVGYIGPSGKYAIQPTYEAGSEFSDGLAAVCLNEKWGYIDKSGAMAVPPKFAEAGPFVHGRALVFVDDQPKSTNIFDMHRREWKLACIDKHGVLLWGPKSLKDERSMSDRIVDATIIRAVAQLRDGDPAARDKIEAEMKQLPSAAIPLLREYEDAEDPDLCDRIHHTIAYLSSDSKAVEERLMSVLQKWDISEYGVKANTNGSYDIMLYPHPVGDLSPLKGFPIRSLDLRSTGAKDLSPLQGMPLETLVVDGSCDLTPIRGLPLKELHVYGRTNDLAAIEGLKLQKLVVGSCPVTNLALLQGMPLKQLILEAVPVVDLEPLRGMPLSEVILLGLPLTNPTPLQGMQLTNLVLLYCRGVTDVSFVREMPLKSITFDERSATNGMEVLRQLRDLKQINGKPAEQFWRRQDILLDLKARMKANGITYKSIAVDDGGLCIVELAATASTDLSSLKGAPIKALSLGGTKVDDLRALEGMPLQSITLPKTPITHGMDVIRSMTGLQEINGRTSQKFWLAYDSSNHEQEWRGMLDARKVKYAEFRVDEDGRVILNLNGKKIADLSLLKGIPVNVLLMQGAAATDFSPLKGMPLTQLWAEGSSVSDLSPLAGAQIASLNLQGSRIKDLSPLRGMPLRLLYVMGTDVEDLSPLSGMPLDELDIDNTKVTDLSPLKGMRLRKLFIRNVSVTDLSPLEGMGLSELYINNSKVADISLLKRSELRTLGFTPEDISKGLNDLRQLQSLKTIFLSHTNLPSVELPVVEFWNRYDAGEFRAEAH